MPDDPSCQAPQAPTGAVPRTCVPFAHVPAVPVVAVPYVPVPVPSGLPVLSVSGIFPDRAGNVDVLQFLSSWAGEFAAAKADKVPSAVSGNLASLDASGNLADSGATPESIKSAAVAEVVANAPGTMDTLKEIADILGSAQQSGTVLKRISDLESGRVSVDATLTVQGAAADAKAAGDALTPLQLAAWYPDGSVTSMSEWAPKWDGTTGLKYDEAYKDAVNKTIYVCSFCDYALENNSHLAGRVVVPPYVDVDGERYTVVGIGTSGFSAAPSLDSGNVVSVGAPTTVKVIGISSFQRCTSLRSVSAPSATLINPNAFNGCTSLSSASFPAASRVRLQAFYRCTSLEEASLPSASLADAAVFGGCSMLASAELHVAEVSQDSFVDCTSLVSAFLPEATSIKAGVFIGCTSLAVVDFGTRSRPSVPTIVNAISNFAGVPTTCAIVVPDAQYDSWIAASGWSDLYSAGYRFLKHGEWEHARKHEVPTSTSQLTNDGDGTAVNAAFVLSNDERLGDARTPTAHHAAHSTGGSDAIAPADIGAASAADLPYALVAKTPANGTVTLSDRAVNLVNPTVTALPQVWGWSDGEDHGQLAYGVIEDYGDYQEYGWGFSGEGGALLNYDSFGDHYDFVYDSDDATELSFYSYDTGTTVVASLVTPYETDVSSLALPPAVTGKARDFMVRLAMPEDAAMFSWPPGVDFETEDGQMPDVSEPGVYLLAFTETGAGRFALMCRKIQGVA